MRRRVACHDARVSTTKRPAVGAAFGLAAASLFGLSTPFAKKILDGGKGELAVAGVLYAGAALGLSLVGLARRIAGTRTPPAARTPRDRRWLWLATLMGGFVAPALLMVGLARSGGMAASLLLTVETPATALLAWAVFRERITRRVVMGGILVLFGAAAVRAGDAGAGATTLVGALAIVASCLGWAVDNNATARIADGDAIAIARFKCVAAAPFALVLAALFAPASVDPDAWTPADLAITLATGLFGYGMSLACFVRALREIGAARTGALFATAPFLSALASMVVLGDRPTAVLGAAGLILAAGTFLLVTEKKSDAVP